MGEEGGIWMELLEWPKSMKTFIAYTNADQRSSTSEEALNNQADTMTCSVG